MHELQVVLPGQSAAGAEASLCDQELLIVLRPLGCHRFRPLQTAHTINQQMIRSALNGTLACVRQVSLVQLVQLAPWSCMQTYDIVAIAMLQGLLWKRTERLLEHQCKRIPSCNLFILRSCVSLVDPFRRQALHVLLVTNSLCCTMCKSNAGCYRCG